MTATVTRIMDNDGSRILFTWEKENKKESLSIYFELKMVGEKWKKILETNEWLKKRQRRNQHKWSFKILVRIGYEYHHALYCKRRKYLVFLEYGNRTLWNIFASCSARIIFTLFLLFKHILIEHPRFHHILRKKSFLIARD